MTGVSLRGLRKARQLPGILSFIVRHPGNRGRRGRAVARFAAWQLYKRVVGRPITVTFIRGARLRVYPDNQAASAVLYTRLPEFAEMTFVSRFMRPKDRFVDVGANVGTYSVLALTCAANGEVVAFEPHRPTYERLLENLQLNGMYERCVARCCALGDAPGKARFTSGMDSVNHIATGAEGGHLCEVDVETLDAYQHRVEGAALAKLDVEGSELSVLRGAVRWLAKGGPLGWIVELNGSGRRYGVTDAEVVAFLGNYGYVPYEYVPDANQLVPFSVGSQGNAIFLRDHLAALQRLRG